MKIFSIMLIIILSIICIYNGYKLTFAIIESIKNKKNKKGKERE